MLTTHAIYSLLRPKEHSDQQGFSNKLVEHEHVRTLKEDIVPNDG